MISALRPLVHIQPEELQATSPQDAILQLATTFARQAGLGDPAPLIHSALQREATEPTYIGRGMALPHARVEGLKHAGVCIAHAAAGIPWCGKRAQLIAFLAVPEEQPELYLRFMGHLVRWRMHLPDSALSARSLPAPAWEKELSAALAV